MSYLALFFKYFVLGALLGVPVFLVLAILFGIKAEVALSLSVALSVVGLVLAPELVKHFRRAQ